MFQSIMCQRHDVPTLASPTSLIVITTMILVQMTPVSVVMSSDGNYWGLKFEPSRGAGSPDHSENRCRNRN
ncbi:hypothetical protein A0H81_12414 [Grifola frondosa]|uniref:Uncharacterized protein n=1 Tax=Grifola frondosa TaxID=5627 RepID=A0A1C7LSI4_GRIFR|nr:hypothetical protein A0H81_12414 [Grifola frondosa]